MFEDLPSFIKDKKPDIHELEAMLVYLHNWSPCGESITTQNLPIFQILTI
jgi:hypothetical protein